MPEVRAEAKQQGGLLYSQVRLQQMLLEVCWAIGCSTPMSALADASVLWSVVLHL
jgi:hypothetical protein